MSDEIKKLVLQLKVAEETIKKLQSTNRLLLKKLRKMRS
ncbi:hypothetical protein DmLsi_00900 [Lactiplantibacillus plantarum]|nr:hypothetical protein DmLsi_00900 [Lactiplantibacillus plantarum]